MTWFLTQLFFDLVLLFAIGLLFGKLKQTVGDDGRIRQGLQILQNKIAILEDLQQKIDEQFKALSQILDIKNKKMDESVLMASSLIKTLEIKIQEGNKILLDLPDNLKININHEDEQTLIYARAAIISSRGGEDVSPLQLSTHLGISYEEAELIYKLNHKGLQFDITSLPEEIKIRLENEFGNLTPLISRSLKNDFVNDDISQASNSYSSPKPISTNLNYAHSTLAAQQVPAPSHSLSHSLSPSATNQTSIEIKKVQFPKVYL